MSATHRAVPWGTEPLAPTLRGSAVALGLSIRDGRVLDLGAGSAERCEGLPDAQTWEPASSPGDPLGWAQDVTDASIALAIAWPGPAHLSPTQRTPWWQQLSRVLAPGAIAAVRLDMLPGWHPLNALQDFARFHAGRQGLDLPTGLDAVLDLARHTLPEGEGRWFGWLAYLDKLRAEDPSAVPDLEHGPLYAAELHVWADEAAQHGLRWVGDARGPHNASWSLGPALEAWVREEVARHGLPLRGAQISDYADNRHTRLALFTKGEPPAFEEASWDRVTVSAADDRSQHWAFETPRVSPTARLEGESEASRSLAQRLQAGETAPISLLLPGSEGHEAARRLWRLGMAKLQVH
jgi:hypothetical protein